MAKAVSQGIDYFLQHLIHDLKLLTSNPALSSSSLTNRKEVIKQFHNNYDREIISSVILLNNTKKIEFISGLKIPAWTKDEINKSIMELETDLSRNFFITNVFSQVPGDPQSLKLFLVVIKFNNIFSNDKSENYLAYLLNFDSLIEHFITPLKLSNNDFAWILDSNGRLIYHPRHSEMLFNSVFEFKEECSSCHSSFDTQKKIIKSKKASFGEYKIEGEEPSKIFAYVPLKVGNQKWFLIISTFLPEVVSGLKDKFQLFFILGAVIVITIAFFVSIIYYLNFKRIRAEESSKNLEKIHEYQERLNHSSKLATVGELVDSVAHEINTPAGIISANIDSILMQKNYSPLAEELGVIKKQVKRISSYTKSLLNFSKRISFEPERLSIIDVIKESVFLLNHKLKENNVQLVQNFNINNPIIFGDKRQLEQVFLNLLINSVEAVDKGGEIKIKVEDNYLDKNSDHIKIIIEDNGIGIKENDLDKIFDPFYSSGKVNGTGLGLSITRTIIHKHKGIIEVISEYGKKTIFIIELPRGI